MRGRKLWQFVRRVGRVGQMDFEVAVWQMMWLLVSPKRVYRSVYYHKQTKNQWARDDPAFLVILIAALSLAALAYSISFASSPLDSFKLILSFIFLDFLLPGLLISTLAWFAPPVHLPPLHFISHFLASLSLSLSLSLLGGSPTSCCECRRCTVWSSRWSGRTPLTSTATPSSRSL